MRACNCRVCGCEFYEDDSNPAIHYSNPADICWRCEIKEKADKPE